MTYQDRNPTWHDEDGPAKAAGLYAMLSKHHIRPLKVMEVGCGTGAVLASMADWWQAADQHPLCEGWDVAPWPIAQAQSRGNASLTFHCGALPHDAHADLLMCVDVFEHVPDDVAFLKSLRQVAPWMLFRIPLDESWLDRATGRTSLFRTQYGHLHAYTRRKALDCLQRADIEVVDWAFHRIAPDLTLRNVGMAAIRAAAFGVHPRGTVRLLGGWSLVVLGRP